MENQKKSNLKVLLNGLWKENPTFKIMIGMCPVLAVTTAALNGVFMGLATTFVLVFSNIFISLLKNVIPDRVRIPCYIAIIATFVTIVDLVMNAYFPEMHKILGIFIPLIVVNCIILGRAEAFASKNSVIPSAMDGIGMGLGFTFALILIGSIRELLGFGTIFGFAVMPEIIPHATIFILPPGAFLTLAFLLAIFKAGKKESM